MIDIQFRGTNRVRNALRRMATQMPQIVDKAMAPWAKAARRTLKGTPYPPKRPGQKYKRTGRLGNSWRAVRSKPGVWNIKNSAPYSIWVVNRGTQAWMHVGRWWLVQDELGKLTPQLVRDISRELERAWEQ